MSSGHWALKLLPSVIFGIDAFVIVEIDVFVIIGGLLLNLILIVCIVRQLIEIVLIFVGLLEAWLVGLLGVYSTDLSHIH